MSRYDWERAELVIPTAAWAGLKKKVRDAYNERQDTLFACAVKVYDKMPRKRGQWDGDDVDRLACDLVPEGVEPFEVVDAILPSGRGVPRKPKRKDFPHITNRDSVIRPTRFDGISIRFDNENHVLRYNSGENNHQVERARAHPVVRAMFQALNRIAWTRGSGGVGIGNDEYNQDPAGGGAGDGGHYVTFRYGPLGEIGRGGR